MKTFTVKVENVNVTLRVTDTFKNLQAKLTENGIDLDVMSMLIKGKSITESSIVAQCLNVGDKDIEDEMVEFVLPDLPESQRTTEEDAETERSNYLSCRLCGIKTEDPIYIFEESQDISEKINKLLPVSISQLDGLSKYICSACHRKINFIHDFVLLCVENENKFSDIAISNDSSLSPFDSGFIEADKSSHKCYEADKYKCPNCKVSLIILKDGQPQSFDNGSRISLASIHGSNDFESNFELDREKREGITECTTNERMNTRSGKNVKSSSSATVDDSDNISMIRTRSQTQNCSISLNHTAEAIHTENSDNSASTNTKSPKEKGKINLRNIRKRIATDDNGNGKLIEPAKKRKVDSDSLGNALLTMNSDLDVTNITGEFVVLDTLEESNDESVKKHGKRKCEICSLGFFSRGKYLFHMERHETGNLDDFTCRICKKEFSTENVLWEHYKYCHLDSDQFSCTFCGETFDNQSELNDHLQNHRCRDEKLLSTDIDEVQLDNGRKSTKLTCEVCAARYVLRERYEFHMERHKFGNIKSFTCLICEKRFKSENILWDHHQYQHRAGERFACITCQKTFVKRANLNYHLRTFGHKGGKLINSPEQNYQADSNSSVKLSDVGKPRPKITCSECGARFVLQERYKFHMDRHKSGKMDMCVCMLCGRESTNENVLWDHYQYMHKRTKRYVCTTCGKLFHKQSMLSRHQVKYGHKGTKEIDIETDDNAITVDNAAFKKVIADEVVEMKSVNCVLCGEVVWGVDPNLINDAVTCTNCERPGLSLQVDSDGAKIISRRQYHCNMCNKHFTTKDRLEYHIMRHSENMDEFICSTCGKELSTEQALFEHYLYVHKGARPHVCELCGKSYQFKARLKEHMRSHSGERPFACEICGQRCMTNNALRSHKKTHITEKRFPCQICKKAFRKRQDLNEHLERHWKNDKTMMLPQVFSCAICLEMFPTFRILKKHMKEIHNVESQDPILTELQPWFECEECHEKFKHQMSLKVHRERVHEGKMKPIYHCDLCDITYKNARVLSNHIKNKHEGGKRYKCAQCGKEYNQSTSLHNHILLHTGEKPFSCEHCEMTFRTKESRDHHQRKHTGERPYKCPHCNKAFATTTQRREHRKREHDEGNNHHCPECGKVCFGEHGVRSHLNTHMTEKHQTTLQDSAM